ncbi:MAG: serine hydroxymethyltransferase [Gammaproteobacteria bacterium]|nr:serine hydroxymethyltransferase [Pseudomonadota bacterium]MCH9663561.1 serine hydroxymethyltransferase [Gammaproteobacteria bacterium]
MLVHVFIVYIHKIMVLENQDAQIFDVIAQEKTRQEEHVELIASENYASRAVMEAQGSVLTNKYAEGYPGKRFYGGCEFVDIAENIAIERAQQLFHAEYVNVQPHSGSQANAAVYFALVEPGDCILGLSIEQGGHLTHGAKPSFSGRLYNAVHYGLHADTGELNYDEVADMAREHKPRLIVAGFSAYSRVMDWARFRAVADEVGAKLLVDMAHVSGLVAAGLYPSPIEHADVVTTTTHKTLRGPRGGMILAKSRAPLGRRFDSLVFPGAQGGPLMHAIAAKAVCFKEALAPDFKVYQQRVIDNARAMAEVFIKRSYKVVSGGTDNHMFLVDLIGREFSGKDAEERLGACAVTVNKNTVPKEPRSAFVTSGIRIGTPAVTTRGFGVEECRQVTEWICDALDTISDPTAVSGIRAKVLELTSRFPVYSQD